VNYLIPKRITSSEREVTERMDEDDQKVAVEPTSVYVEAGSHPMRFLYVPSTSGEGTTVFATNLRVGPDEAETFCRRYSRRWRIENEYKSITGDFLAKTSSKDYRVRLFHFVFAVLLYNIWRLTDFLLKAGVDGVMDYAPVLTAGECVEIIVSVLIPPDQPAESSLSLLLRSGDTIQQRVNPCDFSRLSVSCACEGSISILNCEKNYSRRRFEPNLSYPDTMKILLRLPSPCSGLLGMRTCEYLEV